MNLRKIFAPSIIIIITGFLIIIILIQKNNLKKNREETTLLEIKLSELENNLLKQGVSSGILLSSKIQLEFKEHCVSLAEVIQNKPKLIFRFTELSCRKCVDEEIRILKEMIHRVNNKDVLILCTYDNMRNVILFQQMNDLEKVSIFNVKENVLGIPLEKEDIPFFFTLDSSLITRNVYIPNSDFKELSLKYFRKINNLYCSDE